MVEPRGHVEHSRSGWPDARTRFSSSAPTVWKMVSRSMGLGDGIGLGAPITPAMRSRPSTPGVAHSEHGLYFRPADGTEA